MKPSSRAKPSSPNSHLHLRTWGSDRHPGSRYSGWAQKYIPGSRPQTQNSILYWGPRPPNQDQDLTPGPCPPTRAQTSIPVARPLLRAQISIWGLGLHPVPNIMPGPRSSSCSPDLELVIQLCVSGPDLHPMLRPTAKSETFRMVPEVHPRTHTSNLESNTVSGAETSSSPRASYGA